MKMRITKEYAELKAWKKHPRGYAVVVLSEGTVLEGAATGTVIRLERVTRNVARATRKLEEIREVFDVDANGMRPRVVVVPYVVKAESPAWEQFSRRAAVILEV